MKKLSVLMVCTANICRSPMAEALLRLRLEQAGLQRRVRVQSAGIQVQRGGARADARAQKAVASLGADASRIRSSALQEADFARHDYIVGMDAGHRDHLQHRCPAEFVPRVHLLLEFAPETGEIEVPDPYFGNFAGFERVLGLIDAGVNGLLLQLRTRPDV